MPWSSWKNCSLFPTKYPKQNKTKQEKTTAVQTELCPRVQFSIRLPLPNPFLFENSAPDVELEDLSDQIPLLSSRLSPRNSSKQFALHGPQPEMRPHHPVSVPQRLSFSEASFSGPQAFPHSRPRLQAGRQTASGLRLGFPSKAILAAGVG